MEGYEVIQGVSMSAVTEVNESHCQIFTASFGTQQNVGWGQIAMQPAWFSIPLNVKKETTDILQPRGEPAI